MCLNSCRYRREIDLHSWTCIHRDGDWLGGVQRYEQTNIGVGMLDHIIDFTSVREISVISVKWMMDLVCFRMDLLIMNQ